MHRNVLSMTTWCIICSGRIVGENKFPLNCTISSVGNISRKYLEWRLSTNRLTFAKSILNMRECTHYLKRHILVKHLYVYHYQSFPVTTYCKIIHYIILHPNNSYVHNWYLVTRFSLSYGGSWHLHYIFIINVMNYQFYIFSGRITRVMECYGVSPGKVSQNSDIIKKWPNMEVLFS